MFRPRGPHRKSRMGCYECKRRKVKCDETKPQCNRCEMNFQKCRYPPAALSTSNKSKDSLLLPNLQPNRPSLSPSISSMSGGSLSFETLTRSSCSDTAGPGLQSSSASPISDGSTLFESPTWSARSTPAEVDEICCGVTTNAALRLSDADLYHHYLQHTSRTLTHCQRDWAALQVGIPTLALQSKTVFHSILALSAVCLCCDMISKDRPPSLDGVKQVLMTGYRHFNLASEQMRELMSQLDAQKTECLLASALLLVPFATATQQINHWISRLSSRHEPWKPLSTTPRDVIVMMRGIKMTLEALDSEDLSIPIAMTVKSATDRSPPLLEINHWVAPPPSYTHAMFPIVASTSKNVFSKFQEDLDALCHQGACPGGANDQVLACAAAWKLLHAIRTATFSSPDSASPHSMGPTAKESINSESFSLLEVGSWLWSYAEKDPIPNSTEPLTMRFLGFLVHAPQAYLDLVLPLLDRRLENPTGITSEDSWGQLTMEQALALDIYAHWSVLMFLVEDESWWIGNLPIVTLTGMVNRYGDRSVTKSKDGEKQWWPGSMLRILREIKRSW